MTGSGEVSAMQQRIVAFFTPAPDSLVAGSLRKGQSKWTGAVHLLWSAWIFVIPSFDHYTWRWAALTLLTYPVFLVLYAKCHLASRRTSLWYALMLVVLGMVLLPWYPSGLSYFIFGCVMLHSCRMGMGRYMLVLAGLNMACLGEAWLLHYSWQSVFSIPITTFIIGFIVNAQRFSNEKDAELQLSHDEVRRLAATAERERISRDLHDLLGHTLSLITLKLELSRKLFDRDPESARREIAEAEKVARYALAEVRGAVTGMRATDLAVELAAARLLLGASGVHLDYEHPAIELPVEIERGLSLILREAATNIARHAEASTARIELLREPAGVRLLVGDNGRGGIGGDGNGLCGMRERVRALGGTLAIDSPQGGGTRLQVRVPLPIVRLVPPARTSLDMSDAAPFASTADGHTAA